MFSSSSAKRMASLVSKSGVRMVVSQRLHRDRTGYIGCRQRVIHGARQAVTELDLHRTHDGLRIVDRFEIRPS